MDYQKLLEISKEVGLPAKKLTDVLFVLKDGKPINNNELLRTVGVSRNVLNKAKERLSPLLNSTSSTTSLSEEGVRFVEENLPSGFMIEEQLWEVLRGGNYEGVLALLHKHKEKRPEPNRKFDQFTATPETTAIRASLMEFFCDIKGKRVLFLGDNDFTSIGVASIRSTRSVEVLDIDKKILDSINNIAEEEKLSISTTRNDLRQKLPSQLKDKFDAVFTDPPYTPEGIGLFLSRAIQALDPDNQAARIYVCYGNSDRAKERYLPIQQLFIDAGLMVRWTFDGFNHYDGAESIGSTSTLFVCDVTPKTKPTIKGAYKEQIYTNR